MLPNVIEVMHALRVKIEAVLHIADEGVVIPGVPKTPHHLYEFTGAPIALLMVEGAVASEIAYVAPRR